MLGYRASVSPSARGGKVAPQNLDSMSHKILFCGLKKSAFLVSVVFPSLAEHFSKNKTGRLEFILAGFTTYVSLFLGVCSVPLFWFSYPGIPVMDVLIQSPSCLTPKYFIHRSVLCRWDLPPKMAIS